MKFKRRTRVSYEINLTPLIDVVFLLLIFFMVSTHFTRESALQVDLPEADGKPAEDKPLMLEVTVAADGRYGVNGRGLAVSDALSLRSAIAEVAGEDTSMPFVITADSQSPYQAVVTVMDVAGKMNFEKLSMTTRQVEAED